MSVTTNTAVTRCRPEYNVHGSGWQGNIFKQEYHKAKKKKYTLRQYFKAVCIDDALVRNYEGSLGTYIDSETVLTFPHRCQVSYRHTIPYIDTIDSNKIQA